MIFKIVPNGKSVISYTQKNKIRYILSFSNLLISDFHNLLQMIYSLLPFQVYLSICSALSPPRSGASMSPLQRKRRVRDYGSMRLPAAMSPIQSMFHRTCPLMSRVAPPTLSQWFHPCSTYVVPKRAVMCSTYIVPDEHYTIGRCSNYVVSSKPKR